jgi:hypothetical protein
MRGYTATQTDSGNEAMRANDNIHAIEHAALDRDQGYFATG